ncbi:pimeloyl-ACP methyl ester carboxylesterase [Neorhizobium alkalisoli]|jgi:pimeloyl-ACP methyl ester carboxylesterase|uniref:Pimeloyl-ACP methyl ester carboxylesterase n=2 Tax=Neorhizobium alkalisoli TaxID=528178 RepID=A0A561Q0P6_9HYPH|nr:pimeloyl-ACP methyl ester carboxylesterase [Neorhizobium alkalisoli]
MPILTLRDDTRLYYKDWGTGPAIVFSHGWPLSSDMWENQMMYLAEEGYRVIAHDRRGFGRSDQPWHGYDHDTFSDDLSELIETLDLQDVTLVGYAMGGGEIARYIGRHGTGRVSRVILIGATTPKLGWSEDYPNGVPEAVFDGVRAGLKADRAEFIRGFARLFFGADREGAAVSEGSLIQLHQIAMQSSLKASHDAVTACAMTDYRPDIRGLNIPVMIIHGEDDAFVPFKATAKQAAELLPGAVLKVYENAPHGLLFTHKDRLNSDILSFLRQ